MSNLGPPASAYESGQPAAATGSRLRGRMGATTEFGVKEQSELSETSPWGDKGRAIDSLPSDARSPRRQARTDETAASVGGVIRGETIVQVPDANLRLARLGGPAKHPRVNLDA